MEAVKGARLNMTRGQEVPLPDKGKLAEEK